MATIRELAAPVLRKLGAIGLFDRPEGPQENAVLAAAQGWYEWWAESQIRSERLISADTTAREYERLTSTENVTVSSPVTIEDAGAEGGYRAPKDGAVFVAALGGPHQVYIYSTRLADWQTVVDLTLDSVAPLADQGLDGLACCIAEWMASDAEREISQRAMRAASMFRMAVNATPEPLARKFY